MRPKDTSSQISLTSMRDDAARQFLVLSTAAKSSEALLEILVKCEADDMKAVQVVVCFQLFVELMDVVAALDVKMGEAILSEGLQEVRFEDLVRELSE